MATPYRRLLAALADDTGPIIAEVAADVARPGEDPAATAALVRPAVDGLLASLAVGPALDALDLGRLRDEGAAAARRGEPVGGPIDRYLSAGWAIWDAATRSPIADPEALAALGAVLLRAGDAAAAAIAEGHGEAERELASRAASARRAFADDLLDLVPGDGDGLARLTRRAVALGVDPVARYVTIAAWLGRDLDDAAPEADRLERALARPSRQPAAASVATAPRPTTSVAGAIAAARRGRLVLVLPEPRASGVAMVSLIAELAGGGDWVAVRGGPVEGLDRIGSSVADGVAALAVVQGSGARGVVVDAGRVDLELALLADRARLTTAVDRELGQLLRAPRNGAELVRTIAAFLAEGQNASATARSLGIAPRTVTYRLRRIETLLGEPLDGPTLRRLATVLLARDLLESTG